MAASARSWLCMMLLAASCSAGGCAGGPYDPHYLYEPRPAVVHMTVPGSDAPARVLASVIGIRRPDAAAGEPAAVEVRFRVENESQRELLVDPLDLALVAGNLESFPAPAVEPADARPIEGMGSATLEARFPFPGDDYPGPFDLSGLNLSWSLAAGGAVLHGSQTFSRVPEYDFYPYSWYPHTHFGVRFGYGYWCD
jgi:hypothetical protein